MELSFSTGVNVVSVRPLTVWIILSLATLISLTSNSSADARAVDSTIYAILLDNEQANSCSGTTSDRSGFAIFVLNTDSSELSIHIEHDINPGDLTGGQIHVAPKCATGPGAYLLGDLTSPIDEVWTLTAPDLQNLIDGNLYLNFNTVANPTGEIRGQIVQEATKFSFTLDESQINTVGFNRTFSHNNGVALCELNAAATEFRFRLCHDVEPPFASGLHIHKGLAGEVGQVQFFIFTPFNPVDTSWVLDKGDLINMFSKNLYLNLHSNLHLDGEVRGQIQQEELRFVTELQARQSHAGAGSGSDHSGFAILTLNGAGDEVSVYIEHEIPLDSATTGEIRLGLQGESGVGIFAFSATTNPISETWPITNSEFENLVAGELYVSIQSLGHTSGEIRGQVPGVTDTALTNYYPQCDVEIDAAQAEACAGTGSTNSAAGFAQLKKGGRQLNIAITHDFPIDSIFAGHVHQGPECSVGPVVFGFSQATSPIKEIWYPTHTDIVNLMRGQLYFNIHTALYPAGAGELRGQILKNLPCCDVPGDANGDAALTIGDVTFLIGRIFGGGPRPDCCEKGDADGSGAITIGDATYLIARIFAGGPAPVCGPEGMTCGA